MRGTSILGGVSVNQEDEQFNDALFEDDYELQSYDKRNQSTSSSLKHMKISVYPQNVLRALISR